MKINYDYLESFTHIEVMVSVKQKVVVTVWGFIVSREKRGGGLGVSMEGMTILIIAVAKHNIYVNAHCNKTEF